MAEDKKDKKPEIKKPKFNTYWVYGAIFLVFIGIQFFGSGSWAQPGRTTQAQFEQYLRDGDIEKIEIVNRKVAKVYLTPDAKTKSIHLKDKQNTLLAPGPNDAAYQFEFGDLQNFEKTIREVKSESSQDTSVEFITESNMWGAFIVVLLPFIVIIGIIGICIFIMI